MIRLIRWIRWLVYAVAALIGLTILLATWLMVPTWSLRFSQWAELYGFAAIISLYLTLIISPLYGVFPYLPGKPVAVKARQALGLSCFGFGLIHACISFWGLLGGFAGLRYLATSYLVAVSFSLSALLILALMAISDWPAIHVWLGRRWKQLHRLVYAAGLLLIFHLLILGSHFSNLGRVIPQTFFVFLFILLFLDLLRLDRYLSKKLSSWPSVGPVFVIGSVLLSLTGFYLFLPVGVPPSINIHAAHIQLAQQAQQTASPFSGAQFAGIPGLTGDRTKRYSVNFQHAAAVTAGADTSLEFSVVDASNGNPVQVFETIYTKTSHLVIVDSQLAYFSHIHPTLEGSTFRVTTSFPHDGVYHLYLDFDPLGAIEQQFGFSLTVGSAVTEVAQQPADTRMTKTFGQVETTLNTHGTLQAANLSVGKQLLSFTLKDATTGQPLTNLEPYLGAFGHLVMVNEQTYDYLHVHPYALATSSRGGPTVDFMPLGIYGPIKPGIYRLFAQFNPDGQLMVADYTVRVE